MADISNFKSNTLINGSEIDDTINNHEDYVTIDAGAANDYISNSGSFISINAGTGNDYVYNNYVIKRNSATGTYETVTPDFVTIDGGEGNDTINNQSGTGGSINSGVGDDIIYNRGNYVTIDAGEGDDSIYSSGENVLVLVDGGQNTVQGNVTIKTGTGNSTLTGDRNTQVYQYVGGNDVITNYSHEDVIHIASGNLDSYSFDGGDLIFHIGSGSIRLKNMTNHAITVKDSKGKTTTQVYGTGYSGQDVIKNLVHAWNNTFLSDNAKLDEAIKLCSHFNSIQEVIDQMIDDCRAAGDADTFLQDYCSIFLDNDDSGAVTGWDAGGLIAKTKDDLLPKCGILTYPSSTTFTKRGLTITVPEKISLNKQEQLVIQGLYSWWMEDAIKLIEETYGLKFTDKPLSINFSFSYEPNESYWALGGPELVLNMAYTSFEESDKSGNGLDAVFSHEITHVMQYNFNSFDTRFMLEAVANFTKGLDYQYSTVSSMRKMASSPENLIVGLDSNDADSGMIFLRYLMKQASDSYDSSKSYAWKDGSSIVGTSAAELLTGSGKNQTISAGKGNDTITAYGEKMKVFGEDGNDYILVSSLASGASINSGSGNDTVENHGNKISISSGVGNDTIKNYGFNVTIDGGTNDDYIKSTGNNVKIMGGNGNDTLLVERTFNYNWDKSAWEYTYHDKATIDGGAGNEFIKNENSNASINAGNDNDTVENHGDNVTINGGAGKDSITNYAEGSKSVIDGGAGNDVINNWAGEIWNEKTQTYDLTPSPDNTTLLGGAGNDSIFNEGSNVSIYGGDDNDILINGQYFETERGGQNVTLSAGNGNDTIISHGSKSFLEGGAGDDSIINGYRYYAPWNAFYDSDSNAYNGNNSTISSGVGNDTIKNCGKNVCFKYASGDGNDLIEGFNTTSIFSISGGEYSTTKSGSDLIVTIGKGKITLQGAANLSKVNIDGTEKNSWKISGNTATYGNLITISGVASGATASNFYISGNTVTIGKAAVQTNGTPVKLLNQSGYTLKLGKGMEAPTNNAGTLKNGIYTFGGKSTGYILDTKNNTIKYSAATSATLELSGVKSAPTAPTDDTLTLNLANFDKNLSVTSNTGKYKFSIASGTYTGKTFTGSNSNDTISNASANLIINSGNGNDSVISSGANIKIDSGNGNDYIKSTGTSSTIFGGAGNDTMAGSSGADTLSGDAGNDILWSGKGNDSMKGGTGNDSLVGYDGDDRISGDAGNDTILGGNGNDFLYGGTDNDYLEGNASSDTLSGAAGNDTLWGGADNDTLTGGAGNDVFIYKPDEGTDHITDYASGDILQILRTDGTNGTYTKATFASNKLTLTINGGGSIIFDNVSAGDKININGTTRTIAGNTLK